MEQLMQRRTTPRAEWLRPAVPVADFDLFPGLLLIISDYVLLASLRLAPPAAN